MTAFNKLVSLDYLVPFYRLFSLAWCHTILWLCSTRLCSAGVLMKILPTIQFGLMPHLTIYNYGKGTWFIFIFLMITSAVKYLTTPLQPSSIPNITTRSSTLWLFCSSNINLSASLVQLKSDNRATPSSIHLPVTSHILGQGSAVRLNHIQIQH